MASKVGMNPNRQITENLMNDYQNQVSLIQTFVRMCNDYQIQVFLTNLGEDVLCENEVMVLPDSLDCHCRS
jgi:hypothetical protein